MVRYGISIDGSTDLHIIQSGSLTVQSPTVIWSYLDPLPPHAILKNQFWIYYITS